MTAATGDRTPGALRDLPNQRRRFGYRTLFILLWRKGEAPSINRLYRLYWEEGLGVRKRKGRKRPLVSGRPPSSWKRGRMLADYSTSSTTRWPMDDTLGSSQP
jgi:hypothetical protein